MKVPVKYKLGHTIVEPWERTDFFCPRCGRKEVWNCADGGDYYAGERYMCIGCERDWYWPNEPAEVEKSTENAQRLAQIKSGG